MAKKVVKKTVKKVSKKVAKKAVKKTAPKKAPAPEKKKGIQPLGDRVLVRITQSQMEERTPSGIILPDSKKQERPQKGVVVAMGAGRIAEDGHVVPMHVAVGDTILYSKYSFDEIEVDNTEYVIVSEGSILAVIVE